MQAAATGTFVAIASFSAVSVATVCFGSHAAAEEKSVIETLTPEAFRALAEGRTIHYTLNGEHYGSERFYGGDRATWQFPGAQCEDGRFWEDGNELCFDYGDAPSCWTVLKAPGDMMVAMSRDGTNVIIDEIDDRPLRCDGEPTS